MAPMEWSDLLPTLVYRPEMPLAFHSGTFWLLFVVFLPVFAALPRGKAMQTAFVVLFSLFFYYLSSGAAVLLLVASSLLTYALSRLMRDLRSRRWARFFLVVSVAASLGVLVWFKYADFFLWNWNAMVGSNFAPLELALPVGLSFYTFQSIGYIVDVYRGERPASCYLHFAFFLTFFPSLLAGPILRARDFLPQLSAPEPQIRARYAGLWLVVLGVVKKTLVADTLAAFDDPVFDNPAFFSGFQSLMAVAGYTLQIYFDFSGYSDIAVGLAAIMGFDIPQNFRHPYRAASLPDFWRRWHVSLTSWLRDYVYIPLGGNRRGAARTYINNLAVMLLCGLWHGAAWRFVLWGGAHGVGLCVARAFRNVKTLALPRALGWALTMSYVSLLWVFFRAPTLQDGGQMLASIFTRFEPGSIPTFAATHWAWIVLFVAAIGYEAVPPAGHDRMAARFAAAPWPFKAATLAAVALLAMYAANTSASPFIYSQF